ncbi:hypothetical protein TeGR_g2049 [Tetraparma gracilis]|uniref:Uncharacterized protein n=1 Tax=Tetraparma gracilis TaxID=2962635 RepID=A0ABQ6MAM8_9STRA|nr:hypothetical protein TeGR_g2049 [Tetraparma gracilis]
MSVAPQPSSPPASSPPAPKARPDQDQLLNLVLSDTQLLISNSALLFKEETDVDALEARLAEIGPATEAQMAVAKAVLKLRREQILEEEKKKDRMVARKKTKRAAELGNDVLEGVVDAYDRSTEQQQKRELGVDPQNWMDWDATLMKSLSVTTSCMLKMLATTASFALIAWGCVALVWTVVDIYGKEEDEGEGNKNMALAMVGLTGCGIVLLFAALQVLINMTQARSYLLLIVPLAVLMGSLFLFFEFNEGAHVNGRVLGGCFAVQGSLTLGTLGFSGYTEGDNLEQSRAVLSLAAKRAKHTLATGKERQKQTFAKRVKAGLIGTLPTFFTIGVLLLLVVGVFELFQLNESIGWKLLVTGLALAIKIVGNKSLLGLLGNLNAWIVDENLYAYEYATSTLVRVLQLSLPDEDTAQKIGLLSAVIEVMVRVFFYCMFLKAGLKNTRMNAEEKLAYAMRGKLRVQDASNDMVVEYMSSISAGLFIVYLAPTGSFSFATTTAVSTNTVVTLCAYQIIPELFLDFYVTFIEVYGGLKEMHTAYWSLETGADSNSKIWANRHGDFFKSFFIKALHTLTIIFFVLAVCLK